MGAVATHARQKRYKQTPRGKYAQHKTNANYRGVAFELSFDEWWEIWCKSGKWEQRGNKTNCYVMMRIGDVGPYKKGNVFIGEFKRNFLLGGERTRFKHTKKSTTVTFTQ